MARHYAPTSSLDGLVDNLRHTVPIAPFSSQCWLGSFVLHLALSFMPLTPSPSWLRKLL